MEEFEYLVKLTALGKQLVEQQHQPLKGDKNEIVLKITQKCMDLLKPSNLWCPLFMDRIDETKPWVECVKCKTRYHISCIRRAIDGGIYNCIECGYDLRKALER
jgi:hypothetical protein